MAFISCNHRLFGRGIVKARAIYDVAPPRECLTNFTEQCSIEREPVVRLSWALTPKTGLFITQPPSSILHDIFARDCCCCCVYRSLAHALNCNMEVPLTINREHTRTCSTSVTNGCVFVSEVATATVPNNSGCDYNVYNAKPILRTWGSSYATLWSHRRMNIQACVSNIRL